MAWTGRRLGEILTARGISGVLLAAFPVEPHEITLPWDDFAMGWFGRSRGQQAIPPVLVDPFQELVGSSSRGQKRGMAATDGKARAQPGITEGPPAAGDLVLVFSDGETDAGASRIP